MSASSSSSSTMRAIVLTQYGAPKEALHFKNVPKPTPNPLDILVRIHAFSINPADSKIRSGGFAKEDLSKDGKILGYDAAGVVVEVGSSVSKFKIGDEVWYSGTFVRNGSNAQYQTVDHRLVSLKPKTLNWEQAAALPLVAITSWELLVEKFSIDRPALRQYNTDKEIQRKLLIIGGAGGIGSFAIQLGKLFGLYVIATASRPESQEFIKQQGADLIIDHSKGIAQELKKHGIEEVDLVYNTGGTDLKDLIPITAAHGGIGIIAFPQPLEDSVAVAAFQKALHIQYELMFLRSFTPLAQRTGDILSHIAHLIDEGKLRSVINPKLTCSWEKINETHELMDSGKTIGKIVCTVQH